MSDQWLEIPDEDVDTGEILQEVRARAARRAATPLDERGENPVALADVLWREIVEGEADQKISIQRRDCDIVPRNYVIEWRVPILGPIHALIRRIINAEVRRYLSSSLEKQSYFNRQVRQLLEDLVEENEHLRQEIEKLRDDIG